MHKIMEHHSTICGRVKDKVALKAAVYYGFCHGTNDVMVQANKMLAKVLLQEDGYVYQVSLALGMPAMLKSRIYIGCGKVNRHLHPPILQEVINEQWFDSKNTDGIKYSASFHPIPDASIALVFTAVMYLPSFIQNNKI